MNTETKAEPSIEDTIEEYAKGKSNIRLPKLDVARHSKHDYFSDDLSDSALYNERFIESHAQKGMGSFALYLMMGAHNFMLPNLLYVIFSDGGADLFIIIVAIIGYLILLTPLYLARIVFSPNPIRFNRQAQCIHMFWNKQTAITFPWKSAEPFSAIGQTSSGRHSLAFLCPIPETAELGEGAEHLQVLEVPGAFISTDQVSINANLDRLEFIRRYMEKGLKAVEPSAQAIKDGTVVAPHEYDSFDAVKPETWFGKIVLFIVWLGGKIGYYLATGPLVDKWVDKQLNSYEWPEEVKQLCSKNADLSGYDTTVIPARTDLYWGFNERGNYCYMDKQGNVAN